MIRMILKVVSLLLLANFLAAAATTLAEPGETAAELAEEEISADFDGASSSRAALFRMAELDRPFDLASSEDANLEVCPAKCSADGLCHQDEQPKGEQPAPWAEPRNELDLWRLLENGFQRHYERQYDKINAYLVEKLPDSTNVAQNIDEANTLWEAERGRGFLALNRPLVEALEQLLQLTSLQLDEVRCSRQAYVILWRNNQAVRGRAQRPRSEMEPARRIETIIHRASKFHSVACFNEYPKRFLALRKQMDPHKLQLVESFFGIYLEGCIRMSSKTVGGKKATEAAYKLLDRYTENDVRRKHLSVSLNEVNGKLEVDLEGVRDLVERYIIEPCRAFVWHFGPDVFVPARFGTRVLNQEDRYNHDHLPFLYSWLQYRLCESLIRSNKDQRRLAKDLAADIWRHRKRAAAAAAAAAKETQ